MNRTRRLATQLVSIIFLCVLCLHDASADAEGRMQLSRILLDSPGLDNSGPVHMDATQSDRGITNMSMSAFGKTQTLTSSQLAALGGRVFNGAGLTYSRGYKNLGGRTVYLLLFHGFASAAKVVTVITFRELGDVRVDNVEPAE